VANAAVTNQDSGASLAPAMPANVSSGARLTTLQLPISHSQRLNNGKPLGTGCEWLWSIATWANGTLSTFLLIGQHFAAAHRMES